MVRQNDLNKARAAFTEQSPTAIMPTAKMPSRGGCFAVPNPTSLNALWRNLDHGKSTTHRACRLRGNSGRGICRLGHKTMPARASRDRRNQKSRPGVGGRSCDGFGAGAWAVDFERKQLVHCARRGGDGAVGGNSAT